MANLFYKLIFIIIALAVAFGAGWKIRAWKDDSTYKQAYFDLIEQVNVEQQKNLVLSKQYNQDVKAYQQANEELKKNVKIEIEQNPIYSDCAVPDHGVQLINAAVSQANQVKSTH